MTITLNGTTGIQNVLGSAASPAESNTTSSNTGVYFPTSTSVGFSAAGAVALTVDASNNIFYTGGTERARIDSSGNVLVGTTTNNSRAPRLALNGNSVTWSVGPSASNSTFVVYNASEVGVYMASGGSAWSPSVSDERLKNKVSNITNSLDAINKLEPLTFFFKNEANEGIPRYGFFAQNVGQAIPDAMLVAPSTNEDFGTVYTYDPSIINVHLVAAIQEQQALITQLTDRIAALEAK